MIADDPRIAAPIEAVTGSRPNRLTPLSGGCIAEIYKVELINGANLVAKISVQGGLAIEGIMLDYLAKHSRLPVPKVLSSSDQLLLLDYIETSGSLTASAEIDAAEHLAALHGITSTQFGGQFGFERDTVIGSLAQPNPWQSSWCDFFRDQRLLAMGRVALESGHLPTDVFDRLEIFCDKLDSYIENSASPSLIHGDIWGGNVLVHEGRIAAFIDPAIYFADAEIELAFSTLFSTFGDTFFNHYNALRPISPGFFEARRDIYNLYPLLVHCALFGGHYATAVDRTLKRYG